MSDLARKVRSLDTKSILLLIEVFIASVCSLLYELLISTAATNLTGNSIAAFSLSIGLFLAGLGIGAYLSKFTSDNQLADRFVLVETTLGLVGGFSVIGLYFARGFTPYFMAFQVGVTLLIGLLSGLEIPFLTRLLHHNKIVFKKIIAEILSFDYLGGLTASLLFPFFCCRCLGLFSSAF